MRSLDLAIAVAIALLGCREGGSARAEARADSPASSHSALHSAVRVRTAHVRVGRLAARDEVSGIVHAFHDATITAETAGRVVERAVERGERVEIGQLLFRLDDSRLALELRRATAMLRSRETDLTHARRELSRGQKLVAENAISDQRLDDLEYRVDSASDALALARIARDTAKRLLDDARISAPFSGVVEETLVDVGDFVSAGKPVASLVELTRARLRAGVTAAEAARLSIGMRARARFTAIGGTSLEATLRSVGRVADPRSGTYDLEFWVENPDGRLREGMLASLELPDEQRAPRPLVPRAALIRRNGHMAVFVATGEAGARRAETRRLIVGGSEGDWTEILEGLEEGELVVVDGQFALTDGVPVVVDSELRASPDAALRTASEQ